MGQEGSLCGNKAIKINNRKSITSPVVNNAETVVGDQFWNTSVDRSTQRNQLNYFGHQKQNLQFLQNLQKNPGRHRHSYPSKNGRYQNQSFCSFCSKTIKYNQQVFKPKCQHNMHVMCLHSLLLKSDKCASCNSKI